jgi:nitrate reductase NapA
MKRRSFLQVLGAGSTGVAAFSCADQEEARWIQANQDALADADLEWKKAPCRYCGTGCGVEAGIKDGRIMAVRGDAANPVNRGMLCVKGYHLPAMLYGEDRLRYPMLRNADGRGFSRISWDEAFDLIASRYQEALDQSGPESVAFYGSGQWGVHDGYAVTKWFRGGLRSNNVEPNARLCMASAVMGFMTQFQSDEPMGCYEDFEVGDDFILWGNNMAEMHPVLFSRMLANKRENPNVRIVDIGTRRTPTTDYADMYVQFTPNGDLALANGILHLLVSQGKVDRAFIRENVVFRRGIEELNRIGYGCFGADGLATDHSAGPAERYGFRDQGRESSFADLERFLADYTPARASELSGVPEQQIQALADMYGDPGRGTVSLWCMGVNQHVRGTWMNNLITDLHLITGKISRPGSNPFSLTGQPSACGTAREVGTLSNRLPADYVVNNPEHRAKAERIWGLPEGTIPARPGYHTMDMFRAFMRGDVKVMWVQTTNPWQSIPHLSRIERNPDDETFLIVSDIYPTASTEVADLVLPSAGWVEREGVFGNSERRTQHWEKMVDPPGEATEDAWQVIQVAKRMGMEHLFPWPDDDWHEPMYEEYRQFGLGIGKDLAAYSQIKQTRGMLWPVVDGQETRYRYAAGYDPYVEKTRGVHFYKAKGYGEKAAFWLRPWHPAAESPDNEYPMWLCTGRILEHWHTGTMTRRVKQLHQAAPNAYVEINRADAVELSIKSGDMVRVVSRRGSIELPAKVDGRGKPPRGSAFIPFFDEAKLANVLTLDSMDNISKEPDFKKCAVRIEQV